MVGLLKHDVISKRVIINKNIKYKPFFDLKCIQTYLFNRVFTLSNLFLLIAS